MAKPITVAIDGYSSTGKSTLAKQLARRFGFTYVDTGAMYRAVTYYALSKNLVGNDGKLSTEHIVMALPRMQIGFEYVDSKENAEIYLNSVNIEDQIRTLGVSNCVSQVSELPEVRRYLVDAQRAMRKTKSIVMDGRDIGTVVFPDAEVKFFVISDQDVRVKRRYDELLQKGHSVTLNEVRENIAQRDYIDTHRVASPLRQAQDAIRIDNTNMTRDEQLDFAASFVEKALKIL